MPGEVGLRPSRFQEHLEENTSLPKEARTPPAAPTRAPPQTPPDAASARDHVDAGKAQNKKGRADKQGKQHAASSKQIAKPKAPSIHSQFISKTDRKSWAGAEGPKASHAQVEQFLQESATLAPLAKSASSRSRLNGWASAALGVASGVAVGVGLFSIAGPAAIAAGMLAGGAIFLVLKKLLSRNPSAETLKKNEAAFHANLGATMRAAAADPSLAAKLDADPRWGDAVKTLNAHFPGHQIHPSLTRAFFDPLNAAQGQSRQMWAEAEPSRFDR